MRGHFGGYFFGQVATFLYLTWVMKNAPEFDLGLWPQFSLYNLLIANFWPLYWVGYFVDKAKADQLYWHVFAVAQARATDMFRIIDYFSL